MSKEVRVTCRADAMESLSTMDARDVADRAYEAMAKIQEAADNLSQIILDNERYLVATDFSIVLACSCLGLPDVHNPDREEPDRDHGVVPCKFIAGTEDNCIALTNILVAQIFDARNRKEK